MKSLFSFCILTLLIFSCNSITNKKENATLNEYYLVGNANNLVSNKNAGVELQIKEVGNKKYKCTGKFDNKNLFGRFEMDGEEFEDPNLSNSLNIKFDGQVILGDNDNSGFPPDTKARFTSTVNIFSDNATGSYLVFEIPNAGRWSTTKQNGLYQLKVVSKDNYDSTINNLNNAEKSNSSSPKFEGEWASDEGWNINITKVSDELYDVKFLNSQTKEIIKKMSGPYNYNSSDKSIHHDVPVDYNDSKSALNDMGKEYRITYTEDGRLYLGGTFYNRQQ